MRWWNHWLRGEDTGILEEPSLAVFMRSGPTSDAPARTTPGEWRWADLPYRPARMLALETATQGELRVARGRQPSRLVADTLIQDPASGTTSGLLWWEVPPDMRRDDAGARTYDGAPLGSDVVIAGIPVARLHVGEWDCAAHWIVRLEDVRPDGRVDFVTGGGGSCRAPDGSSTGPAEFSVPLRFVTWTFRAGHRIRMAVTNAQFPMVWPSPLRRTSLLIGNGGTRLELPLPRLLARPGPVWPAPESRESTPGLEKLDSGAPTYSRVVRDRHEGTVRVEEAWGESRRFGARKWTDRIAYAHRVRENDPAAAGFEGEARFTAEADGRTIEVVTSLTVESDVSSFSVVFERRLAVDGVAARTRVWRERFERRR